MARYIIPIPKAHAVAVDDLAPGDWVADSHMGPWHQVDRVATADGLLWLGEDPAALASTSYEPGAQVLRLSAKDAPRPVRRRWS